MDAKKIAIGIVALAVIGFAALQLTGGKKTETATQTMQTETTSNGTTNEDVVMKEDSTTEEANESAYKNGTYTAVGTYEAPPGEEEIGVTLTLEDGVITESSLDKLGKAPLSQKMQTAFESGYKELVVGKNIDDIDLDVVSGSSLTPNGFENALEQIKKQAQS